FRYLACTPTFRSDLVDATEFGPLRSLPILGKERSEYNDKLLEGKVLLSASQIFSQVPIQLCVLGACLTHSRALSSCGLERGRLERLRVRLGRFAIFIR